MRRRQSMRSVVVVVVVVVTACTLLLDVCALNVNKARDIKPCCSYSQFEAITYQTVGAYDQDQNVASLTYSQNTIHYDYDHKLIAVETMRRSGSNISTFRSIQDYNKKIVWIITGMACVKNNFTEDLHSHCVAENAVLQRNQDIASVKAQTWYVPPPVNMTSILRITVSTTDCVPIHESLLVMAEKSTMSLLLFHNVTQGIRDPSVFQVPDFCQKAEERPTLFAPPHKLGFHSHLSKNIPDKR